MKFHFIKNIILLSILVTLFSRCTEAYPLITNRYEEVLVVEANLTNELKRHEIMLTKSAKFEDESYLTENGAEVFITDDAGNQYNFSQDSDKYVSDVEFQAVPNIKYQLHIKTQNGGSFESSPEALTTVTPIQSVAASVTEKDGVNGVGIRVKSFDSGSTSNYYRFEYEETYKVIAPKWRPIKIEWNSATQAPDFVPNSPDTKTCYGFKKNVEILLESTNNLKEDRIDYLIRFINSKDYIITNRYSILVKQYIESKAAYDYYNTLKKTAASGGTIVSPTQPGFLLGNLKSVNSNSKIAGYFDVCSVSTERIYFNYEDLFPGKFPPPYVVDCNEFCYSSVEEFVPVPCTNWGHYAEDLSRGKIAYYSGTGSSGGFTYWVDAPCGDCTTIASNIKPPFWVDN